MAETITEAGIPAVIAVTCWVAIFALALVWIGGAMDPDE